MQPDQREGCIKCSVQLQVIDSAVMSEVVGTFVDDTGGSEQF